jgi:cytochrome c biogenesis protein CcmG/thiol:disulfide interchange protein DsbE
VNIRRVLIPVFGVALLGALWYGTRLARASAAAFGIGAPAPDFHAVTLDDPPLPRGIGTYRGEVVLLNLWATWCGPCVVEMPSIQRLHDRYASRGLKVVAVAVDDPGFETTIREFVSRLGLTFEILHEGSGDIERDYRSRGIPMTYIIARDGRIRVIRQGATDWDAPAHRALVERLLAPDE